MIRERLSVWRILLVGFLLAATAACDTPETVTEPDYCVPDRAAWENHASPVVAQHCGLCHGEAPAFGAPFSLTDYDALVEGPLGSRVVDRIVRQLKEDAMPPAPYPKPAHPEFDTMILWASCGEVHPDYQDGLECTAPVFQPPEDAPEDVEAWDIRADGFEVKTNYLDRYQCFAVDAPMDEARLIRRVELLMDDARVLHHVVLYRDKGRRHNLGSFGCTGVPGGTDFVYSWAPGQGAIQFPEGGFRVEPGERYLLQIHYNNAAGIEDVFDDSGVRIFHGALGGTEYGMFVPGPELLMIAPQKTVTFTGICNIREETTLLATMPHMHDIGKEFHMEVERADGTREDLLGLWGWSFEAQLFYEIPVTLHRGDKLRTTCVFDNPSETETVFFGANTSNEMCYAFTYATPAPSRRTCNDAMEVH